MFVAADVLQQLLGWGRSIHSSVRLPRAYMCHCEAYKPMRGGQQGKPAGGLPPGCQGRSHQRLWGYCCFQQVRLIVAVQR